MSDLRSRAIEALQRAGWRITLRPVAHFQLPDEISARYPHLPSSLTEFLSGLASCTNEDETAWFLCEGDFLGTSGSAWRWNEFEIMERDEAKTEEKKATVVRFWDAHMPILMSVRTGYSVFAINVEPEKYGQVAHILMEYGVSEPTYMASTFEVFLEELIVTAETGKGEFSADV